MKEGWQTSEFWLKIVAFLLSSLLASGAIPTTGPVAQAVAIAATMLGALGYTVVRGSVKKTAMKLGYLPGNLPANTNEAAPERMAQAGFADATVVWMLAFVSMLIIGGMLIAAACSKQEVSKVVAQLEDCTNGELASVAPIAANDAPLVISGAMPWSSVEKAAIAAGESVGGCFLVDVVADVEQAMKSSGGSGTKAVAPGGREALAHFRSATGTKKTFHTAAADY